MDLGYICRECGSGEVEVEMKLGKDSRVYFNVQCPICGCFSHTLKRGLINVAVENWLIVRKLNQSNTEI